MEACSPALCISLVVSPTFGRQLKGRLRECLLFLFGILKQGLQDFQANLVRTTTHSLLAGAKKHPFGEARLHKRASNRWCSFQNHLETHIMIYIHIHILIFIFIYLI